MISETEDFVWMRRSSSDFPPPRTSFDLHPILGPKEMIDLYGRVAAVTGSALGIGTAIKKIKDESDSKAQIEWLPCDLGNLKSADGIDRIFAVNWLGHFYAVNLLYPLVSKTSKSRYTTPLQIIFDSSELHQITLPTTKCASKEEINDPSKDPTKDGLIEQVVKANNDNVYSLSLEPGAANTDMQHPDFTVMTTFGRSPEQGSSSMVYAAVSPEVEEKEEAMVNWDQKL
ncbi:hypothetical protein BDW67DRAFT_175390 [Aspergillus spinulosporus]